ncbi:hypothetical protein GLOIN_2v1866989 [Rhizophagus clarus]|uniref:F-box domain-containing protein n=1 Tax=Rhizophagus clarus TaxID=94130 RepID=A0A8H3KUL7_9GLOM|nr:hypothetical protein GLOIN_2v1866989 [Rhizophagus clarus]
MSPKLNIDILYLIFDELRNDKKSLCSCLLVNKIFCEIVIQILWKNPWKYLEYGRESLLLNIIISHLSKESRNNLKCHGIYPLINLNEKLSFNYISFCKYLNLDIIKRMIYMFEYHECHEISIIQNEIIKLFINENTKFTHLYVPQGFDYQISLIPEKYVNQLENSKFMSKRKTTIMSLQFNKILENSLRKHSQSMRHFKISAPPVTKILSSFENLKELELDSNYHYSWDCLENLSLPFLQILKTRAIPVEKLANLIENTNGHLTKINIDYVFYEEIDNRRIIQAIYQKCPKLEYLKIILMRNNIKEFEKVLINCKYLDELFISVDNLFDPRELFEILAKSSPASLFKFKFSNLFIPDKLESLKQFLDNWKGRHPMFLQFNYRDIKEFSALMRLIKKYKALGIIKRYNMHFE